MNSGLSNHYINALAGSGTSLFAGTNGSGVFVTNDDGDTWNSVSADIFNTTTIYRLVAGKKQLYAGTAGSGVWRRPLSDMIPSVVTELLVTHTGDAAPGSLRQALTDANEHTGPDTIRFAIPESDPEYDNGVFSIRPL